MFTAFEYVQVLTSQNLQITKTVLWTTFEYVQVLK